MGKSRCVAVAAGASVAAAVREHGLSWPIVQAAFVAKADEHLIEPWPVRVLGIDETRGRQAGALEQRSVSGKWLKLDTFETNFFDLDGDGGLLGQAPGRTKGAAIQWLDACGQEWKDGVQIVAIDPSATYRAAIRHALPNAVIVADHFHLVMLANKMVTGVRQRVVRETCGRRGLATDPIWAGRRRLLRGREPCRTGRWRRCGTGSSRATRPIRSSRPGSRKKNCVPCSPRHAPVRSATTSPTAWTAPAPGAPDPEQVSRKSSDWQPRDKDQSPSSLKNHIVGQNYPCPACGHCD